MHVLKTRSTALCLASALSLLFLSLPILSVPGIALAGPANMSLHEYFVYRDKVQDLGGAKLELGKWDYHDENGHWIPVPRLLRGKISGPGVVVSAPFNGFNPDPGWTRIVVHGTYNSLEVRGAEDDGSLRGKPGPFDAFVEMKDGSIPQNLANAQYLSYRINLGPGDQVQGIDLVMTREIRDRHPRLLVDDLDSVRQRCMGALSHQCEMNSAFANSNHLTDPLSNYDDSKLARVAKVMAFEYMMKGTKVHADRVRAILLELASRSRQHWKDLHDSIQDLGLGWIGLSWMLALDWTWPALEETPGDLQKIVDGTVVFVDYLLEMYKHTDFNNHFYLGRSPVILAGLVLFGEGYRDDKAGEYLDKGLDFLFNHEHPALNSVAGGDGGWHESLGYFDGEMGYPVFVDMDGLRTASGLDFFQDSSFFRTLPYWYLSSTVPWDKTLVHWADQGKDRWSKALDGSESEGKNTRDYMTGVVKNLRRLHYPEAELGQYLLDDMIGTYYDSSGYAESYYKVAHMNDVLFYEPGAPARPLEDKPSSRLFEHLGEIIMRQGNSRSAPMAMFACADFRGGHQQSDNGHFSIWYKGYLAVDSGYYDHWGSDHHMNYARRTIAHNTLTITMPGETFTNTSYNDGGQNFTCDTSYYNLPMENTDCDACDMTLTTNQDPYFDFIHADLTKSYSSDKVDLVTREFVWIRPDSFVVFDRVESTDADYKKRFLLHGQGQFNKSGDTYYVDDGQGRLFVETLLPKAPEVVQIGGAGHEWEVDSVNYPPSRGQEFAGTHRLEISPPAPSRFDLFLHVMQVSDQSASSMEPSTSMEAGNAVAALAGDWLVWFAKKDRLSSLEYEIEWHKAQHVIVGDMEPLGVYVVETGKARQVKRADQNGVLYFLDKENGKHVVRIGPAGGEVEIPETREADAWLEQEKEENADALNSEQSADADAAKIPDTGGNTEEPAAISGLNGSCGCASFGSHGNGSGMFSLPWLLFLLSLVAGKNRLLGRTAPKHGAKRGRR
ncbi:MAG: hypothetical protein GXP49_02015 [Deltaproteobacteria bacterium]|nr:hypothetical protein [Deltaproteobacteria bacterium]